MLALEYACGTLHHSGSVLNGKALSPARRRLFEVFLDESQGGGMGPFWRHPRQPDAAGDMRQQMGGVADRAAQRGRIQVNEEIGRGTGRKGARVWVGEQ